PSPKATSCTPHSTSPLVSTRGAHASRGLPSSNFRSCSASATTRNCRRLASTGILTTPPSWSLQLSRHLRRDEPNTDHSSRKRFSVHQDSARPHRIGRYRPHVAVDDYNRRAIGAPRHAQVLAGARSANAFARLLAERGHGSPSQSPYRRWIA